MGKLAILGIDGAAWALLDPLLAAGRLPHLARLARQGVRGALRSTIHPLTPAAWTSAVTGLNPGKHGIYDFRRRRAGAYDLELVNARQRDGQPLWSLLRAQGKSVGVFNVPMTYPPDNVNGFCVSGMDAPGPASAFTHPAALRAALLTAVPAYKIDLDEATADPGVYLERVLALAQAQQQALHWLLEKHPGLDFLMAVYVATDRLYHAFWSHLDPTAETGAMPLAAEARAVHEHVMAGVDDSLGRLWDWAGDDATLIVMSDHGFGPLHKDVYMNRFLLDAGFLRFRPAAEGAPATFAQMVDWSHTRAYSFGFFGSIYLNLRGREPQGIVEQGREAEETKRTLTDALRSLRDPDDGRPLVDAVYRREDLYSGPFAGESPDLLVIMRDYAYMTRDGYEAEQGSLLAPPMRRAQGRLAHTGNHRLDGVFLMAGPDVRPGGEVSGAGLVDIAPTALYALGLPVAAGMDGHVLRQAFTDEALRRRPPQRIQAPPQPAPGAGQRRLADLARRLSELEAAARRHSEEEQAAAHYARELENAIADKNAHIAALEAALRAQTAEQERYQRSLFHRAHQRWQRLRGRAPRER